SVVGVVMIVGLDCHAGNATMAKHVEPTRALIVWPAQDGTALQPSKLVNTKSSIAVAREVGLAAANQKRVSRRVCWIELQGAHGQRDRVIHKWCPGCAAIARLLQTALRCADVRRVRIRGIDGHGCHAPADGSVRKRDPVRIRRYSLAIWVWHWS